MRRYDPRQVLTLPRRGSALLKDFAGLRRLWPYVRGHRREILVAAGLIPVVSAFQTLQTLNILEGYDVGGLGHNAEAYLHHLIEAIKLASADRLAYAYRPGAPIGCEGIRSPGQDRCSWY